MTLAERVAMTSSSSAHDLFLAPSFDGARAEAFVGRVVGALNGAALSLMLSLGHRTGLFDCMSGLTPSTSTEIAAAARLDERYVREWLGAMVTGGVVDYDPEQRTYVLPPEHAASLTRASAANLAVAAQFVPVLGGVEERIVHCFQHGGGVPYEAYHRFHEVMAEESAQSIVAALDSIILPIVPGLVERLRAGIDVLDIGCGSGRAMIALAALFPNSRFHGYDVSAPPIETARRMARVAELHNVSFDVRDVARLDVAEAFDLITAFDAIHDQAQPATVLSNIADALRPGGVFLMQDIRGSSHVHEDVKNPMGTWLYTISCMHCMTVSLSAGGVGLGAMWGQATAREMLAAAGFADVRVEQLPHDVLNDYYVARVNAR
jgi:2-polyprenyl-3-methyl-5-hydroxy-6-metoxy-1,4-benzoquinol methylase